MVLHAVLLCCIFLLACVLTLSISFYTLSFGKQMERLTFVSSSLSLASICPSLCSFLHVLFTSCNCTHHTRNIIVALASLTLCHCVSVLWLEVGQAATSISKPFRICFATFKFMNIKNRPSKKVCVSVRVSWARLEMFTL